MFIQTQETPNPNTLKFLPGCEVVVGGSLHITRKDFDQSIPLASEIFTIPEVESIFLAADFISVTKSTDADWFIVKADVISLLIDYFSHHKVLDVANISEASDLDEPEPDYDEETMKTVNEIKNIIETNIRPTVAMDGGDIVFKKFVDGIVYLQLRGACSTCPSSQATLKNGVENMLKHYIPAIQEVQAIA